jgi:hypothetical protein
MQVAVSPKAILQAIEHLKVMCDTSEWYSEELPRDPENLYRHVGALLAGQDPPELVPAKIVEVGAQSFPWQIGAGKDAAEAEARLRPIGTSESFQAAAEWGFIFYRDFLPDPLPVLPLAVTPQSSGSGSANEMGTSEGPGQRFTITAPCAFPGKIESS